MDKFAFGKLLTKLRQRDNMTQSDLADALNVSVSAVSKWETGKNFPDIPIFAELKKLFGLSYDDLYHPEQTMTALEAGTLTSVEERTVSSDAAATAARKNHLAVRLLSLLLALVLGLNAFFLIREVFFSPADAAEPSAGSMPPNPPMTAKPFRRFTKFILWQNILKKSPTQSGRTSSTDMPKTGGKKIQTLKFITFGYMPTIM